MPAQTVCVCERERECQVQESQLGFEIPAVLVHQCMLKPIYNVCVCVCVREREREREWVCVHATNNFSL